MISQAQWRPPNWWRGDHKCWRDADIRVVPNRNLGMDEVGERTKGGFLALKIDHRDPPQLGQGAPCVAEEEEMRMD